MSPFTYKTADSLDAAVRAGAPDGAAYLAGGTTMLDLMKLTVIQPTELVHVDPATPRDVQAGDGAVSLGAGCRMSEAANDGALDAMPAVRESLLLAASPQIRNMASLGGNLLQRTRCPYFRDVSQACNKREPGSGCSAIGEEADNRSLAVLGVSESCIAHYPGDFAVACVALDASLDLVGPDGERSVKLREFYKLPGETPHVENDLRPGEVVTRISIPTGAAAKNSLYHKVRERSSYAFAIASVAVGLEMDGETIKNCRLALGGVGSVPWHSPEAEEALRGKRANEETFTAAAEAALDGATPAAHNGFKVPLAKRAIVDALTMLASGEARRGTDLWHLQHGR